MCVCVCVCERGVCVGVCVCVCVCGCVRQCHCLRCLHLSCSDICICVNSGYSIILLIFLHALILCGDGCCVIIDTCHYAASNLLVKLLPVFLLCNDEMKQT